MGEEREHGDRHQFLEEARRRLAGGVRPNPVHPPPDAGDDVAVTGYGVLGSGVLDQDVLIRTFARTVEEAGGTCHVVEGDVPDVLLDLLVSELEAWDVAVSAEPEAAALAARLAQRGVESHASTRETAAEARVGITSARAGVAATGSLVLDSSRTGSRTVSALPPVHLCVLPADRIVATPGDVLRPLGDDPAAVPPSLVVATGPSRSGDIEQILTVGAHGPAALHVIVVR